MNPQRCIEYVYSRDPNTRQLNTGFSLGAMKQGQNTCRDKRYMCTLKADMCNYLFGSMTMGFLVLLGGMTSLDVASNKVVIEDSWRDLSISKYT